MKCLREVKHSVEDVAERLKMWNKIPAHAELKDATYHPPEGKATFTYNDGVDLFKLEMHWREIQDMVGGIDADPDEEAVGIFIGLPDTQGKSGNEIFKIDEELDIGSITIKLDRKPQEASLTNPTAPLKKRQPKLEGNLFWQSKGGRVEIEIHPAFVALGTITGFAAFLYLLVTSF